MPNLFPSELTGYSRSVDEQKINYTEHFLVFRIKPVSYFVHNKRGFKIIVNYENILQVMKTLFLVKIKKKITINFRKLFDLAIGL